MVGRSTNGKLDIGGVSTAVGWKEIVEDANQTLAKPLGVRTSSRLSGIGGSDHMSFGEASRPALFFFTGLHSDYHKPSDTADKINYATMAPDRRLGRGVIERIARSPRIEYVKPLEPPLESGPTSRGAEQGLRTWLGTIPDYGAGGRGSSSPGNERGLARAESWDAGQGHPQESRELRDPRYQRSDRGAGPPQAGATRSRCNSSAMEPHTKLTLTLGARK
mgnify:CR=1 FL=1